MSVAWVWLGLGIALVIQTTLVVIFAGNGAPVDLVLVVVIAVALSKGPVVGLWTGTSGGLLQDLLSGGLVGVGGLAKTLVGYFVGQFGTHFMVARPWDQLLVFFFGSVVHSGIYIGVDSLLSDAGSLSSYRAVVIQAIINSLTGVGVGFGVRITPWLIARRRLRRRLNKGESFE